MRPVTKAVANQAMTVTDPDRLILIRHAMPEIDPQTPAELWQLGHEGRTAPRLGDAAPRA